LRGWVMSVLMRSRMCWWSGGEGRRGVAADDAQGAGEFDAVGVDAGFGGGGADQGADGVVGQQVAVDFLADHVRAFGPQDAAGAAQGGLELTVGGLKERALVHT
jgi:hypothetical protein